MTRIRIGDDITEIPDEAWPEWVRAGRVPPDALVLSLQWTMGIWRRADSLTAYHLYLDTRTAESTTLLPEGPVERHGLFRLFRGRGIALTEVLLALNVMVSGLLVLRWRHHYSDALWAWSRELRGELLDGRLYVLFIPLFLHADLGHLMANMVSLYGIGAIVEEYYGRARTGILYVGGGLIGALFSLSKGRDVLAVGASGAIFALYGVLLVFLLRYGRRFASRLRWKTLRVYLPFLVAIVAPSIFYADLLSHVGGFLGGALLALGVPAVADRFPDARTASPPAR